MTAAQKKNLIIGLLVIVFSLLVLAIYLPARQRLLDQIEQQDSRQVMAPEHATSIQILDAKGQATRLEKRDNTWLIKSPVEQPADNQRVNVLLTMLTLPDSNSYPLDEVDAKELGLQPETMQITINDHQFLLGDNIEGTQLRYLQFDNRIYLTNDVVVPLMRSSASALLQD